MTAATIPRIRAADEPALMGASLLGADVAWVVAPVRECVLVTSPKVAPPFELEVRDAELKVLFRIIAVPVPVALAAPVMLMLELLDAVVELPED